MPKHTSLSCQQLELNNAAIHVAAKSKVETKRAKKVAKKIAVEAREDECDHCDNGE